MSKSNNCKKFPMKLFGGILIIFLMSIIIGIIGALIINLPLELAAIKYPHSGQEILTWLLALLLPLVLIGVGWWQYYQRRGFPKWTKQTTVIVLLGVLSLSLIELSLMVLNGWLYQTTATPNNVSLLSLKKIGKLFQVTVIIMAPMMEELIYRGGCQQLLASCLTDFQHGTWWAVLLSSLVFGLVHQGGTLIGQLTYILMGIGLAVVYQKTGDLRACTMVHVINNCLAIL